MGKEILICGNDLKDLHLNLLLVKRKKDGFDLSLRTWVR